MAEFDWARLSLPPPAQGSKPLKKLEDLPDAVMYSTIYGSVQFHWKSFHGACQARLHQYASQHTFRSISSQPSGAVFPF